MKYKVNLKKTELLRKQAFGLRDKANIGVSGHHKALTGRL